MTPELRASLASDKTMDRAEAARTTVEAYGALKADVDSAQTAMSGADYQKYWQILNTQMQQRVDDLARGFAMANFGRLDKDGNGRLDREEVSPRQAKSELELNMLGSLTKNFVELKDRTKTGSWWNLYQIDPDAITKEDLKQALFTSDDLRNYRRIPPVLTGTKYDTTNDDIPTSVQNLLHDRGVAIKSVPGRLGTALPASYLDTHPIAALASAIYNPETREIITERSSGAQGDKQHEIGHAIDDALAPGENYFSDNKAFTEAVDEDVRAATITATNSGARAATKIDWQEEIPSGHVFMVGQLQNGNLLPSGRRELFADLYQTRNTNLTGQLRHMFPHAAAVVDSKLALEGIERFSQ